MGDNANNVMSPTPWRPGEPISAKKLNQLVEVEARRLRGANEARNTDGGVYAVKKSFEVVDIFGDYLECRSFEADATEQNDDVIYVAKPYLLRNSITIRDGISYAYGASTQSRTATLGATSETQVVVPSYVVGDIIIASSNIVGGIGVQTDDGQDIEWVDDNSDGRAWAEEAQ